MEKIWQAIAANTALAVSDGSFQEQHRACAWIIEGNQSEDWITGRLV